jgi:flagellar motor switch protein FliG
VAYVPRENTDAAAFLLAIGFEQAGELIEGFNERIRFARQPRKA